MHPLTKGHSWGPWVSGLSLRAVHSCRISGCIMHCMHTGDVACFQTGRLLVGHERAVSDRGLGWVALLTVKRYSPLTACSHILFPSDRCAGVSDAGVAALLTVKGKQLCSEGLLTYTFFIWQVRGRVGRRGGGAGGQRQTTLLRGPAHIYICYLAGAPGCRTRGWRRWRPAPRTWRCCGWTAAGGSPRSAWRRWRRPAAGCGWAGPLINFPCLCLHCCVSSAAALLLGRAWRSIGQAVAVARMASSSMQAAYLHHRPCGQRLQELTTWECGRVSDEAVAAVAVQQDAGNPNCSQTLLSIPAGAVDPGVQPGERRGGGSRGGARQPGGAGRVGYPRDRGGHRQGARYCLQVRSVSPPQHDACTLDCPRAPRVMACS